MARNLGREFATMTDDERRRFELDPAADRADSSEPRLEDLEMGDPRGDPEGRVYATASDERADPDARDGEAALLDDAAHQRSTEAERRRQGG